MRLYDRVVGAGFASVWASDPPMYIPDAMQKAARFDVTNVAEYLDGFPETQEWNLCDAPALTIPFGTMWMEWHSGGTWAGMLARQVDDIDGEIEQQFDVFMDDRELYSLTEGRPMHIGAFTLRVDSTDGSYIPNSVGFVVTKKTASSATWIDMIHTKIPAASMSISFLHCKNVVSVDAPPHGTRQQLRFAERRGLKAAQFKTLVIEPMKQVLKTEGDIERHGLRKALHICRGHFKTYTAEKPRFGRDVGTFWVQPHVRGSADVGMVAKDYAVKAPRS